MLPSHPVSILYDIVILLLPACVSNLAVSIDQFLFMYTELILTISISSSLYSWRHLFLHLVDHPAPSTVVDLPEVFHLATLCTHLAICWALPWLADFPHSNLHGCHCMVLFTGSLALSSFAFSDALILSNCLDSVNVFNYHCLGPLHF